MVTQRPLPRSSWMVLLLALVAAVLACHGFAAAATSDHQHGVVAAHAASGIDAPPCHPMDGDQRAGGDLLTCAAPAVGTGLGLAAQPTGVLQYVDRTAAEAGSTGSTSVDRGPPTLAELQLLRI